MARLLDRRRLSLCFEDWGPEEGDMLSSSFSSVSISHEPLGVLKYNDLSFLYCLSCIVLSLSSSLLCFLLRMGTPVHTAFLLLTNFLFPFIFFSSISHFLLLISLSSSHRVILFPFSFILWPFHFVPLHCPLILFAVSPPLFSSFPYYFLPWCPSHYTHVRLFWCCFSVIFGSEVPPVWPTALRHYSKYFSFLIFVFL